jgi:hypothetical protein
LRKKSKLSIYFSKVNIVTIQKEINQLIRAIIWYAIEVHKELGPGLLESILLKKTERQFA